MLISHISNFLSKFRQAGGWRYNYTQMMDFRKKIQLVMSRTRWFLGKMLGKSPQVLSQLKTRISRHSRGNIKLIQLRRDQATCCRCGTISVWTTGYFPRHAYCKKSMAKERFEPSTYWLRNKQIQAPARARTHDLESARQTHYPLGHGDENMEY